MVPDVAKAGHSFNGAFAYYLHDKRQDEVAAQPVTAERVDWTETRNLITDDPETARRVMIATAYSADELKAAAGVKASGRKSTAHVYAYALAWHPDEAARLDRAEMVRAVDQSLKVLGAEKHQALIVCHTDRAHPHVHVILNRVDPETGKMLATSNDFRKLSDWANAYERERGQIVTPLREEKRIARESFQKAAAAPESTKAPAPAAPSKSPGSADYEKQGGDSRAPDRRRSHQSPTRTAAAGQQRLPAKPKPPSEAAILKALTDDQKARHKAAWPALSAKSKAERSAIFAAYGEQIKTASAQHKEMSRPLWAQHFRQERQASTAFAARERETFGVIANALAAAKYQQATGQAPSRGLLSLTFANVLSADSRAAAFTAQQETRRGEIARQLRQALDADVAKLKDARSAALDRQRQAFTIERAALIATQDAERAKIREAWKQVYTRRGKEPDDPRARQDARPMELQPVKKDFDEARRLAAANPPTHPTERKFVSTPAPTPSPAGTPPLPARSVQDVPRQPEPVMPAVKPASSASPAKDWTKAATPAVPAPAQTTAAKDWGNSATPPQASPLPAKDWNAKPEPRREIKPLPERGKDRDWER